MGDDKSRPAAPRGSAEVDEAGAAPTPNRRRGPRRHRSPDSGGFFESMYWGGWIGALVYAFFRYANTPRRDDELTGLRRRIARLEGRISAD